MKWSEFTDDDLMKIEGDYDKFKGQSKTDTPTERRGRSMGREWYRHPNLKIPADNRVLESSGLCKCPPIIGERIRPG